MALADALRTFMYVSLWGKPVISVARGLGGLIKSLFRAGEQGFAYDINDLTTLYQDAAGTIPVTGAGQPVGLVLDKSKSIPYTRRNLLTYSEEFNNSAWLKTNVSVSTNSTTAPDGTQTADKLVESATTSEHFLISSAYTAIASAHTLSIYAKVGERTRFFCDFKSLDAVQGRVLFDLSANAVTIIYGTATSASITDVGNGWKRCVFTATLAAGTNTAKLGIYTASTNYAGDGSSGIYLWGMQLEVGSIATPYQKVESNYGGWVAGNHAYQTTSSMRPLLQRNATTGAYYLAFDGTDDFLVTNSINFTATDKVSLFAGVRKLSDAARGMICEFSASIGSSNGAFSLEGSTTVGNSDYYAYQSKGTSLATLGIFSPSLMAPSSAVLTAKSQVSSDFAQLKANSLLPTTSAVDQGAGNYGNYPLYIGRRGGASFPFNGHLYSLIGIGRLTSDSETIALEKSIAKNVGVAI